MRIIVFILVSSMALNIFTAAARAETINVFTTDYIRDLNPLNEETPAMQWASNLLAYKLFRRMCRDGQGVVKMSPECIHHSNRMRQGVISIKMPHYNRMNFCRFKRSSNFSTSQEFLFDSLSHTIKQLNGKPTNQYFGNRLQYRAGANPELVLNRPQGLSEDGARYLDFPLLQSAQSRGLPMDTAAPISPKDFKDLNRISFGRFKLVQANPQFLKMQLRGNFRSYCKGNSCNQSAQSKVTEVQVKYGRFGDVVNRIIRQKNDPSNPDKPHIILNVNAIEMKAMSGNNLYTSVFSDKGNGQYYLGFNYALRGIKADLFGDQEFRRYLAQSFWNTSVLKQKMIGLGTRNENSSSSSGEWFGQTFRGLYLNPVDRLSDNRLKERIQQYLVENHKRLKGGITLKIMMSPEALRLFATSDRSRLRAELNQLWKCRDVAKCAPQSFRQAVAIRFIIKRQPSPDLVAKQLKNGDFDLVVDRLIHGDRLGPIVNFLTPQHDANFLKLSERHINMEKLARWQTGLHDDEAYREINDWLGKTYHVIALGQLPIRDVYYSDMVASAQKLYCGDKGSLELPFGVLKWQAPQ